MVERFDLYLHIETDVVLFAHYVRWHTNHDVMLDQVADFCENLPAPIFVFLTDTEALELSQKIFILNQAVGEVEIRPTSYEEKQIKNRYDLILQSYSDEEYIKYALTIGILQRFTVLDINRRYLNFNTMPKTILRNAIEQDVISTKEVFENAGGKLTVVPTQFADPHLAPIFSFFQW